MSTQYTNLLNAFLLCFHWLCHLSRPLQPPQSVIRITVVLVDLCTALFYWWFFCTSNSDRWPWSILWPLSEQGASCVYVTDVQLLSDVSCLSLQPSTYMTCRTVTFIYTDDCWVLSLTNFKHNLGLRCYVADLQREHYCIYCICV